MPRFQVWTDAWRQGRNRGPRGAEAKPLKAERFINNRSDVHVSPSPAPPLPAPQEEGSPHPLCGPRPRSVRPPSPAGVRPSSLTPRADFRL